MKTTKIIFLLGTAGSGKDTVGRMFVNKGYTRVSFADTLKEEYANHLGIDVSLLHKQGPQKEKLRAGIIKYAEDKKKTDPLIWLNKAFEKHRDTNGQFKDGIKLVVTDFRRDCEVDWYYNLWEQIQEYEFHEELHKKKKHPIDLRMFYINRDTTDKDPLTHFTVGKVHGINKVHQGFIDAVIHNNEIVGSNPDGVPTDAEYEEMKVALQKKIDRLFLIFNL